jgi:hypothetical protein
MTRHRFACCSVIALLSCHASPREPDASGRYVDVYLDDGVLACEGQVAAYDRFIEQIAGFWAPEVLPDFRADVHVIAGTLDGHCTGGAAGCGSHGSVFIHSEVVQYHELGHLVHEAADGRSAPPIEEGVAQALGNPVADVLDPPSFDEAGVRFEPLFGGSFTRGDYLSAGLFARFLVDRHGVDAMRQYFRSMAPPELWTPDGFTRQFADAFDEQPSEAWTDFESERRCGYDFWYCGDHEELVTPLVLDELDCEAQGMLGFDASAASYDGLEPVHVLDLSLPDARSLVVTVVHASVRAARCGNCEDQRMGPYAVMQDVPDGVEPPPFRFDLEPGTYRFIVRKLGVPFHLSIVDAN